jgi:hypothetical protein
VSDELWIEASADHEGLVREAAFARADAELEPVMSFLLGARSPQEFAHRSALAQESVRSVASLCGVGEDELMATARRRFELYRQALAEGVDPLQEVVDCSHASGGPEKPDEHSTGPAPDAYSEVPPAPPRGPAPQVTQVRPPQMGPVQEATGSLRRRADTGGAADMTPFYTPPMPPDTGTGMGSTDTSVPGANTNDMTPSLPNSGPAGANAPMPEIGQVTSSKDPVRRQVLATAALIRQANRHLPPAECERVARQVVGRYLTADLAGSVMDDDPGSGGGDGGGSHDSGTGPFGHMLEWKGLNSMMPGGGGGAAGEAAGAGEGLGELAGLAAL